MDKVWFKSISDLRQLLEKKKITAEALVSIYLDRIKKYDGKSGLNAVARIDETALDQAKKMDQTGGITKLPLFGIPILIKDNIDVKGFPTTAGSPALADNIAAEDAEVVKRLRMNGAIILGKTNMTEFANFTTQGMPGGYSSLGGQVKHEYDANRDASGSSTGSAVAVAAGLCAAAIGTDTSFSVVGCAAEHGLVGLKPPVGKLSQKGIIPIAHTLDSAGPLTHTLDDALLLYACMGGRNFTGIAEKSPKTMKVAVNQSNVDMVSEAQMAYYQKVFQRVAGKGAVFYNIKQDFSKFQKVIMVCEFKHDLEGYLMDTKARRKTLAEIVSCYEATPDMRKYGISLLQESIEKSNDLSDTIYLKALYDRESQKDVIANAIANYDVCVMTGPTNIMHYAGLPSLALPLCMGKDHTPRGIILYGANEQRLYSAAKTIEGLCPGVTPPKL